MKKALLLAALLAACSKTSPPVIDSFTADKTDVSAGDPVVLTWVARGATSFDLSPQPGDVTGKTTVTVNPAQTTQYTLTAKNGGGLVTSTVQIFVSSAAAPSVRSFYATPAQVAPGTPVTLRWVVGSAAKIELIDGATTTDVTVQTQAIVTPTTTTTYTLRVSGAGTPVTATTIVRVSAAPTIASFTRSASPINRGDPVTLTWSGDAATWTLTPQGGTPQRFLGSSSPISLVVRPQGTTIYTLVGTSTAGIDSAPATVTVVVTDAAAATLTYSAISSGTAALKLVCTTGVTITCDVQANNNISARGFALNMPIDPNKVTVGPLTATGLTGAATGIAVGTAGPLKDVLVIGAALKGSSAGPAADIAFAADASLATFTLSVKPGGGVGVVFDGATADPKTFATEVRSASGASGITTGRLDAAP